MKLLLIIFIILLLIVILLIFSIRKAITKFCKQNFGMNVKEIVESARNIENDTPKSISSMERLILPLVNEDFPDLNINELKQIAETKIMECLNYIEENKEVDPKLISNKVVTWINSKLEDYKDIHFEKIKFHKTLLNKYEKKQGVATIYLQSTLEYYQVENEQSKKVQDRFQTEFIYVYDVSKADNKMTALGLNCPNCGAPIKNIGVKKCGYCGTGILELAKKVWVFSNIKQY